MPPPASQIEKPFDVVVAAVALGHRRAAELAAPDDSVSSSMPRCLRSLIRAAVA
jgi:hypothetical protein